MDWSIKLAEPAKNKFATNELIDGDELLKFSLLTTGACLVVLMVFWLFADLDLAIAKSFYSDGKGFFLKSDGFLQFVRSLILYSMVAFYAVVIICWIRSWQRYSPALGLTWDKWFYLALCGLTGPIIIVNMVLKAHWGRARPRDLSEFSGTLEYSDFWVWSDQCLSNCSFTSGEVAGVAAIVFSLAMITSYPLRYVLVLIGLMFAAFVGWIRVAMGAHFVSDSIMSTLLMMIVCAEIYYLVFLRSNRWMVNLDTKQSAKVDRKRLTQR